jgi:hypothetical protein
MMPTTSAPSSTPAWSGWWRAGRRSPWRLLAGGADYHGCWQALLDVLEDQGLRGGDSLVLAAGRHPDGAAVRRETAGAN